MTVPVKLCGLTTQGDVDAAATAGAAYMGLVFFDRAEAIGDFFLFGKGWEKKSSLQPIIQFEEHFLDNNSYTTFEKRFANFGLLAEIMQEVNHQYFLHLTLLVKSYILELQFL